MEYLDIYDENAKRTGRIIVRGTPVRLGEYSMSVHLYIYNRAGEFLVQKRSKNKRSLPGIWSVTCGAVTAGENSVEAGVREAAEEVGLFLSPDELEMAGRVKKKRSFIDIYFAKKDFSTEKCVLQKEEVEEIRMCSARELLSIIQASERANSGYTAVIENAMKARGML